MDILLGINASLRPVSLRVSLANETATQHSEPANLVKLKAAQFHLPLPLHSSHPTEYPRYPSTTTNTYDSFGCLTFGRNVPVKMSPRTVPNGSRRLCPATATACLTFWPSHRRGAVACATMWYGVEATSIFISVRLVALRQPSKHCKLSI